MPYDPEDRLFKALQLYAALKALQVDTWQDHEFESAMKAAHDSALNWARIYIESIRR